MDLFDEELKMALRALQAAGGMTSMDQSAPREVKQAFLQMLLDCPDCRALLPKSN